MPQPLSKLTPPATSTAHPLQKSVTQLILISLYALFLLNTLFHFEKLLYANEMLSIFGLFFYIKSLPSLLKKSNDPIFFLVHFLFAYALVNALISLIFANYLYGYLRTVVLVYSLPCFFLGMEFRKRCFDLFDNPTFAKFAFPITFLIFLFGDNIATPFLLPLLFRRYKFYSIIILLCLLGLALRNHVLTAYAMLASTAIIMLIQKRSSAKKIFFHPIFVSTLIILFFFGVIVGYYYFYHEFFLYGYAATHPIIRNNTIWRLMYWGYELTSKNLFHALVGIGFGTPIFNIYNPLNHFLFEGPPSVVYPYALGAHNFLIFTFTRLGLTGLIPVIAIYLCFFNQVRHKRLDSKTNALFLAFILMTVGALCNVVFATPVYSGTYWVLAGMLFQSLTKIPYNSQ